MRGTETQREAEWLPLGRFSDKLNSLFSLYFSKIFLQGYKPFLSKELKDIVEVKHLHLEEKAIPASD